MSEVFRPDEAKELSAFRLLYYKTFYWSIFMPKYQRDYCTKLCPRIKDSEKLCDLCKALDESDQFCKKFITFFQKFLWSLWQYSGTREICALINPNWKAATEPKPSAFIFWASGVIGVVVSAYVAAFGLASGRYENRLVCLQALILGLTLQREPHFTR